MKQPDSSFEDLWSKAQPEHKPEAAQLIRQAEAWQRRERFEQYLAFGLISLTVLFMGYLCYRFYPSEDALPPLAIALFLIFSLARAGRYLRRLGRRYQQSLHETLDEQRKVALRLQNFLHRVYMPGLTFSIIAGLWISVGQHSLVYFLLGSGLTIGWMFLAGWWGRKRQNHKLTRLEGLLQQLKAEDE